MVAETRAAFGRLDVLCNNAGITSSAPFKDLDAIDIEIGMDGALDAEQRERLMEIAEKCPVKNLSL